MTNRFLTAACLSALAVLAAPTAAMAIDRVVDNGGSGVGPSGADCATAPFTTIQAAITAAGAGDRILICEGTYVEQLDVNKGVELIGAGDGSRIKSPPSAVLQTRFTIDGIGQQPVVWANANNVEIRSLEIDGDRQQFQNGLQSLTGVSAENRSGLVIDDTHITNIQKNPFDGLQVGFSARVDNTDGVARTLTITDNRLDNYQKGGLVIRGLGLDATVTGNTITGIGPTIHLAQNGISMGRSTSGLIANNTVTDNLCNELTCGPNTGTQTHASGIISSALVGPAGPTITIRGNDVRRNDDGISLSMRDDSTRVVEDNLLKDNRYTGLYVQDGVVETNRNRVEGGPDGIVALSGAQGFVPTVRMTGNTIQGAGNGIRVIQIGGAQNPSPIVTAHYNRIVGNTVGLASGSTGAVDAENNWWGCNAGPGAAGCDSLAGSGVAGIDANPWLVLGISATPTTVDFGQQAVVTADLRRNSNGASVADDFPDGVPVAFSTTLGSLDPVADVTSAAEGRTRLSGGPGDAIVSATVDNQTVSTGPIRLLAQASPTGPPDTYMTKKPTLKHPKRSILRFRSTQPGSTFVCKVDDGDPYPCTSRQNVKGLSRGRHHFEVTATNSAGVSDPTPAKARFFVRNPHR